MTQVTMDTYIEARSSRGKVVNQFADIRLFHNWVNTQSVKNPELVKTLSFHRVTTIKKDEPLECPAVMRS